MASISIDVWFGILFILGFICIFFKKSETKRINTILIWITSLEILCWHLNIFQRLLTFVSSRFHHINPDKCIRMMFDQKRKNKLFISFSLFSMRLNFNFSKRVPKKLVSSPWRKKITMEKKPKNSFTCTLISSSQNLTTWCDRSEIWNGFVSL